MNEDKMNGSPVVLDHSLLVLLSYQSQEGSLGTLPISAPRGQSLVLTGRLGHAVQGKKQQ